MPAERKSTPTPPDQADLPPIMAWREDIEAIASLLHRAYPDLALQLQTCHYKLDAIEDLATIPETEICHIRMTTSDGNIQVSLGHSNSSVRVSNPDFSTKGLLAELTRKIEDHRRKRPLLQAARLITAFVLILSAVLGAKSGAFNAPPSVDLPGWAWPWVMICSLLLLLALSVPKNKSRIFTRTRAEAPTFFSRKKDDLLIEAGVAVVSLILGGFLGYWINTIT